MGTKICMNSSCGATASSEWKKGWVLRSGGHADLCYTCGSAYENSLYCDIFHLEQSGWRECSICSKCLHCGCIASRSLLELLDYGGVGCTSCARSSELPLKQNNGIANGLSSSKTSNLEPASVNNLECGTVDGGRLAELCKFIEANEPNMLPQFEGIDTSARLGQLRQEETTHSMGKVDASFLNVAHPSIRSSTFSNADNSGSLLDMRDMCGSLSQPSLSMAFGAPPAITSSVAFPVAVAEGREHGQSLSFQHGYRSRPLLPKLLKPDVATSSEAKKVAPELCIARPPADGRGRSQLLPRYWPRITEQELQQLSGDLNSNIVPLFEKVLSASDAGRIGRLVLPKACAEAYFPPISQSEGLPITIHDVKGREWTFQFRFWPNNNSRMYVLEGVTPCIQSMQLQAGDTITFSRRDPGRELVIGFRKAMNNSPDKQVVQTSALPNAAAPMDTSFSANGEGWDKSENNGGRIDGGSLLQPVTTAEKKRTRNIGTKSKRLLMHNEDALELRLTWEEAQDLLRPPPSVGPSIVTVEDHEFEEYDEAPVFGKRTIFTAQPSGDQEQWVQCDDCSKWRKLPLDAVLPLKWTCSENVWDSTRCTCSATEEMSFRDLDNLLRLSKDFKKRRTGELQKPIQEREPSGLDALANAAVLGDGRSDGGESSAAATTKHPRHRSGCTCIVCIQPPSGKGKHKDTCTCNVCMTVKRRFKTLMLRKKKRQSKREAETLQEDKNDQNDESETNGTVSPSGQGLYEKFSENEGNKSRTQTEEAETSTGQIDLNCHPYRELDVPIPSMMNLVDTGNIPLDNYTKLNGVAPGLICEQ